MRIAICRGEAKRPEEDFLADGLNVLNVAKHAVEVRQDRSVVAFVQEGKRLLVASLGAAHELLVRRSAEGHRLKVAGFGLHGRFTRPRFVYGAIHVK